jgi:hypothetical protein
MSATRDQIGISSFRVQGIMPTTGTSRRAAKNRPDDRKTDYPRTESDDETPSPRPPGSGRLVDKAI